MRDLIIRGVIARIHTVTCGARFAECRLCHIAECRRNRLEGFDVVALMELMKHIVDTARGGTAELLSNHSRHTLGFLCAVELSAKRIAHANAS